MRQILFSALIAALAAILSVTASADPVRGSGSTFAYPVLAKWSQAYLEHKAGDSDFVSDSGLDYEPIGSLGGMLRLAQPDIDFAATDSPFPPADLRKFGYVQFPFVMGGIVAAVNLDGVDTGTVKLTGPLLADIYLGKIQNWSDPALKTVNPDIALPNLNPDSG